MHIHIYIYTKICICLFVRRIRTTKGSQRQPQLPACNLDTPDAPVAQTPPPHIQPLRPSGGSPGGGDVLILCIGQSARVY